MLTEKGFHGSSVDATQRVQTKQHTGVAHLLLGPRARHVLLQEVAHAGVHFLNHLRLLQAYGPCNTADNTVLIVLNTATSLHIICSFLSVALFTLQNVCFVGVLFK